MFAGILAGHSGRTPEGYTLDLRQFISWCDEHRVRLFEGTPTHIDLYARELEELGRAPATIGGSAARCARARATSLLADRGDA